LANTELKLRFQEKDLRKKVATDMDLDLAAALLGHTSADTTQRHYRLKGRKVKPNVPQK
jgi:integrase